MQCVSTLYEDKIHIHNGKSEVHCMYQNRNGGTVLV